jgi:hypothetical protein
MLNLRPLPLREPVTQDRGAAELICIWHGLDADGRRMLLAQARAVAEVTGRVPKAEKPA